LLLKDRLCQSLGHFAGAVKRPFNVVNVIAEKPKQQAVAETAPAAGSGAPRSRTTSGTYYQV